MSKDRKMVIWKQGIKGMRGVSEWMSDSVCDLSSSLVAQLLKADFTLENVSKGYLCDNMRIYLIFILINAEWTMELKVTAY